MSPGAYMAGGLAIATLGVLIQLLVSSRAAGRIEGVVTTSLGNLSEKIKEHKDDFDKEIDALKKVDAQQWQRLDEHSTQIANVKGRLGINGRSTSAGL